MENGVRTFQSFQQRKREIKQEGYDTTKKLTYLQALETVKEYLRPFAERELEEATKRKKNNIVIEKNKTYLRERFTVVSARIRELVEREELRVEGMTREEFIKTAVSELEGHDILEDAFEDDEITDIFVYRWDKIYCEKAGDNTLYHKTFRNEKHYEMFIERIVRESGAKLDSGSNKISDFELWGDRYCATNKAISPAGDSLTIRKHSDSHITLEDLFRSRTLDAITAQFFNLAIIGQTNWIYAGITGSGKTTDVRALLDKYIPMTNRRVLVAEDTRELYLSHDQVLDLQSFKSKEEDAKVDLSRLIHTALRLKPKYIAVGEVRGAEAEGVTRAVMSFITL